MGTKKRIYVGLLAASLLFILLLAAAVYYLIINRDLILNQVLLIGITAIAIFLFIILLGGIIAIVFIIIRSKPIPALENLSQKVNDFLFPVALFTGKLIGISREKILQSYIAVNNCLIGLKNLNLKGNQVLILVPHCLQNSDCPHKITVNVDNCKDCGKCDITSLKKLAEKYNAVLKVATGGTLARKYVSENRPQGVIAIACERDLSLGIHEMGHLPVLGVLNCRPNGPCFNTQVDLNQVEKALKCIIKEDDLYA